MTQTAHDRRADLTVLGAFEAGFAASVIFYLTTFYQRGELGVRVAVFLSCQCLSGAFSGLISYGVFQADSHLHGWQILFLLEVSHSRDEPLSRSTDRVP